MPNGRGVNDAMKFMAGWLKGKEEQKKRQEQQKMNQIISDIARQGQMEATMKWDPDKGWSYSLKPKKVTEVKPEQRLKGLGREVYGLPGGIPPTRREAQPFMPMVSPGPGPMGRPGGGFVGPRPGGVAEYAPGYEPMPLPAGEYPTELAYPGMRERFGELGLGPSFPGMKKAPPGQTEMYRRDLREAIRTADFSVAKKKYPEKVDQIQKIENRERLRGIVIKPLAFLESRRLNTNTPTKEVLKNIKEIKDLEELLKYEEDYKKQGVDVEFILNHFKGQR